MIPSSGKLSDLLYAINWVITDGGDQFTNSDERGYGELKRAKVAAEKLLSRSPRSSLVKFYCSIVLTAAERMSEEVYLMLCHAYEELGRSFPSHRRAARARYEAIYDKIWEELELYLESFSPAHTERLFELFHELMELPLEENALAKLKQTYARAFSVSLLLE